MGIKRPQLPKLPKLKKPKNLPKGLPSRKTMLWSGVVSLTLIVATCGVLAASSSHGTQGNSTAPHNAPQLEAPANIPAIPNTEPDNCIPARAGSCSSTVNPAVKPESELYTQLQRDPASIKNIEFVSGTNQVIVELSDDTRYKVYAADSFDTQNMRELAISKGVHFSSTEKLPAKNNSWIPSLIALAALTFVVIFGIVYRRKQRAKVDGESGENSNGGSSGGGFGGASGTPGSSGHWQAHDSSSAEKVTFADVIGQDAAKKAGMGIVRYLKNPERVKKTGAKIPRGVLFTGPGGLGKTLLARAIAGEAGVKFLDLDGGSVLDTYVGVGAKRIKQLFADARAVKAPCIIFIDEIDGLAARRSKGDDSDKGNDEAARTLGTLLTEMDGFRTSNHPYPIVVIAATNRVEALDPAILRAGRFTRKIRLTMPKLPDVIRLFEHYSKRLQLSEDVNLEVCAKKAVGLPGASIENICNEAALMLVDDENEDAVEVTQAHMLAAVDAEVRQQVSTSPAKRFNPEENSTKLCNVIGQKIAIEDVGDIIDYLKNPQEFEERGVKMPRGTLFVGPPGEGKTLLARAVAGEAGVPFFSVAGSEFTNKYVGVGADRVREVFEQAKLNAPSIVFIDEIDSIGQKRSTSPEGGDSERNTTLNQLLVEMDGFDGESRVVVLAATNRPDILDEALLRPGRFDRQATFYKPDYADRLPLLQYYFRDKMLACDVDLDHFAHNTAGFSAASIANIANEAALLAARQKVLMITAKHVDDAITRVLIGAERKTRLMSEREKLNVAVHEAGHAVTYHVASSGEPIARITIMPRGDSGGHVQTMNNDRFLMTDKEILVQICMALGGRAAQQMILGVTDTGASSDFQQARRLAYMFVAEYGMSDLGPLTSVQGVERSPEEKRLIETQVQKILQECEQWAQRIIRDNRTNFDRLVEILLVRETILGPEFAAILAGQSVPDVDTGNFLTADCVAALPFSETPVADDVVDGSADEKTGRTSLGVVGKVIGGVLGSTRARLPHLRRTKNEEQVAAAA